MTSYNAAPPMPQSYRITDTRRSSRPAAQWAWEEYLKSCVRIGLLLDNIDLDEEGNLVVYDQLDEADCDHLGLDNGDGPLDVWVVLAPLEEDS